MPQSIADKIAEAQQRKAEGNAHFAKGDLKKALYSYHTAWLFIKGLNASVSMVPESARQDVSSDEKSSIDQLTVSLHLNLAAVHLKEGKNEKVIDDCNTLLAIDPSNVKGRFRRGKARLALGNLDGAEEDLLAAKAKAPTDGGIARELKVLEHKKGKAAQREKKLYANMFSRMEGENRSAEATATAADAATAEAPPPSSTSSE